MVDHPEHNPTAGARLLRSMLQGPQDLTISETANPLSQRMWERLGGLTVTAYSMEWMRMLRPAAFGATMAAERVSVAGCLLPLTSPLDWMLARVKHNPFLVTANQTAGARCCCRRGRHHRGNAGVPGRLSLAPAMGSAADALDAASRSGKGASRPAATSAGARLRTVGPSAAIFTTGGRAASPLCCIFSHGRGTADAVVESLFAHAFAQGFVGLKGRTQPEITDTLLRHRCVLRHAGSMVVHSRQPELIDVIRCGDAMISGLVAESWTRLIGGDFR